MALEPVGAHEVDDIGEGAPLLDTAGGATGDNSQELLSVMQAEVMAESKIVRRSDGSPYPLDTPVGDLGKLGVGVGLYFNFVYYVGIFMTLMALLSLPAMISNAYGKAAVSPDEGISFPRNMLASLSLGNHREGKPVTMQAVMDFLSSLAFIACICLFRRSQVKKAQEIEVTNITASDYSVHVMNLPSDARTEKEISDHMSRFGDVQRVVISFDDGKLINIERERQTVLDEIEHWRQAQYKGTEGMSEGRHRMAQCNRLLDKLDVEAEALRDATLPCTGHAFVTFTLESSAIQCVQEYSQYSRLFGLLSTDMEQGKKFRGLYALQVRRAPQPSDVIWENLGYGAWSRAWRQILATLFSLLLVLIATGMIAAVNGKHFIFPMTHLAFVEAMGLNVVTVVVILAANIFLFITIPKLAKFEKFHYKSSLEVVVMLRLFFFQVLNTIIAAMLMWDASTNTEGQPDWLHWFADGGFFVFNIQIGDALLMNAIEFFRPFDVMWNRKVKAKKALTQKELNRCYDPPEYSLGMRYQFVLKAVFVALFFGAGLPFAYCVAALLLLGTYWIDKYNVLRVYQRPANYNDDVATVAGVAILPMAVLMHLCMGLYWYTVVVECPQELTCNPTSKMTLSYVLLLADMGIMLFVWHPFLIRRPDVSFEMVRAREVPYNCVKSIASYDPPTLPRTGGAQDMPAVPDDEINVNIF